MLAAEPDTSSVDIMKAIKICNIDLVDSFVHALCDLNSDTCYASATNDVKASDERTSIIADDIDTTTPLSGLRDHVCDLVLLGDIALNEDRRLVAMLVLDLLVDTVRRNISDDDPSTRVCESKARRFAQSRATACDHCLHACE
jgi:hypothetical protein